ncbi:MAG: DUF433 domain-containing protein [Coleofasciculus sp. D1-CHI-01]|uniref:DUF433 domain-containing protein n=1 Tax=Coleofasciculus sp. D1-CHI-01 TaxID=3068482 RepID=UPI0032FDD015
MQQNQPTIQQLKELLAVEHILGMLAAGDTIEKLLASYPWLEPEDVHACLLYAREFIADNNV